MSPLHLLTLDWSKFIFDCKTYGLSVGFVFFIFSNLNRVTEHSFSFFPAIHQGKCGSVPAVLSE